MDVIVSERAQRDYNGLPAPMRLRVLAVTRRLEQWPQVSGVKWLTGAWVGHARIRTGDWRVVFHVEAESVVIDRIAHRREVYE